MIMDEKLQAECTGQVWRYVGTQLWSQIWHPMDVPVIKNVDGYVIYQLWEGLRVQAIEQLRRHNYD